LTKKNRVIIEWLKAPHRLVVAVLLVLVVVAGLGAIGLYRASEPRSASLSLAKTLPYPAAYAAGRIVTYADWWQHVGFVRSTADSKGETVDLSKVRSSVLADEIDQLIIRRAAGHYGVKVTGSDVDQAYAADVKDLAPEAEIAETLSRVYGMTIPDYKNVHRDLLLRQRLTDKLLEKRVLKKAGAKHILIAVASDADDSAVNRAKDKAADIIKQLQGGKDFAALAKSESEDKGSRDQGGELGEFTAGSLDGAFEDAVFAAEAGKLIDHPVRSKWGWHVIFAQKNEGEFKSFDDWLNTERAGTKIIKFVK